MVREQDEVDHQTATQTAWIPLELEFPLVRFETEHSTDGTSLGTLLTTGLEAQWGQPGSFSCAQDFIEGVGVLYLHHQVCVFHDASFTQVNSWRWSGDVTFLSTEFVERRFPDGSTEGGTFIFNFTGEAGPVPPIALGATYTIRFEVQGSEPGARTYGSTIVVPIDQVHVPWWIQFGLTTEARWVQPERCFDFVEDGEEEDIYNLWNFCEEWDLYEAGRFGSVSWSPPAPESETPKTTRGSPSQP